MHGVVGAAQRSPDKHIFQIIELRVQRLILKNHILIVSFFQFLGVSDLSVFLSQALNLILKFINHALWHLHLGSLTLVYALCPLEARSLGLELRLIALVKLRRHLNFLASVELGTSRLEKFVLHLEKLDLLFERVDYLVFSVHLQDWFVLDVHGATRVVHRTQGLLGIGV